MNKTFTKLLTLLLALVMVIGLASCSSGANQPSSNPNTSKDPANSTEPGTDTPSEFLLGSLTSTAGTFALLCGSESQGVHMAVDEINANGGLNINGTMVPVKLIEYDVGTDPNTQIEYTQRLVTSDKVTMIQGLLNSGTMANELEVTTPGKVIVYNATGSPAVLVTSPYGVNCSDTGVIESHSLMELWGESVETLNAAGLPGEQIKAAKRIAVFGMNEPYTQLAALGLKDGCEKYGMEFVGSVMFQSGTTDYLSYVNALKELQPDVVLLNTYSDDTMIPPLRDMLQVGGLDWTKGEILLLGNDVMCGAAFIESAAAQGIDVNGAICFAKTPDTVSDAYKAWEAKALEYAPEYAGMITYVQDGYEPTMCMFRAMEAAGTCTDTEAIMNVLNGDFVYQALNGEWTFSNGQLAATEYMKIVKDGQCVGTGLSYGADTLMYGSALSYPF